MNAVRYGDYSRDVSGWFLGMTGTQLALVTLAVGTGWPDIVLGGLIIVLNGRAALEVWRLAGEESLAGRALAGEDPDAD